MSPDKKPDFSHSLEIHRRIIDSDRFWGIDSLAPSCMANRAFAGAGLELPRFPEKETVVEIIEIEPWLLELADE